MILVLMHKVRRVWIMIFVLLREITLLSVYFEYILTHKNTPHLHIKYIKCNNCSYRITLNWNVKDTPSPVSFILCHFFNLNYLFVFNIYRIPKVINFGLLFVIQAWLIWILFILIFFICKTSILGNRCQISRFQSQV